MRAVAFENESASGQTPPAPGSPCSGSTHAGQASDEPEVADAAESCCESLFESDQLDALLALAVGGALIATALVFRRIFKIF